MKYAVLAVFFVCCCCTIALAAEPTTAPIRQPKYPLKTERALHTDAEIARARDNIAKYPTAKNLADKVIKTADEWVAWKDDDLRFLLTSADVPRAFAVNAAGCPKCGGKIIEKSGGDYGWIIDPKLPFKVKCPVDGSIYPTNDYETYYRSGFKTRIGWDTPYVDDGWGAPAPAAAGEGGESGEGGAGDAKKSPSEKFWFVAYYNHWMWHKHLVPAMAALADAYTLTGDARYAHKAAVMLQRIAEVYPAMDHAKQSRYGAMMAKQGRDYPGKVVNNIWETSIAQSIAEAYDAVWETIDADAELQRVTGKPGKDIRAFIEANALEDAIDAYFQGKIRGNFGMHQGALVRLAQVRQHGETNKWFDSLLNENGAERASLGLNYALYNLISRDGVPSESAPGYNNIWVRKIAEYGDVLQDAGRDVFGNPRAKRLFDATLDQMVLDGKFTPSIGDSGNVYGALVGANADTFQIAYRRYNDPSYAAFLAKLNASGANSFRSFESLFHPPIDVSPGTKMPPARPRLLDGAGIAILNNPADTISLALTYGQHHGHGHYDRLNFELFSGDAKGGQPIMPDLGYPDAMNDFVPGIYTWSKNTVSHNTVVVDGHRQVGEAPGEVTLFASGDWVRVVDVEAKGTYEQCWRYRRAMIMVDVDKDRSYFIDVFTVAGGRQHDYVLHGPPGEFQMIGGEWGEPAKGTLAGENVALGEIYDDANLAKARGGFSAYRGSGFQHLFNVRTQQKSGGFAEFHHEKDPASKLRIRVLDQPDQALMLCDARVSPVKNPAVLKYLIARRTSERPLDSRFVSVIEPFHGEPIIKSVTPLKLDTGEGVALAVERTDGKTDIVIYDLVGSRKTIRARKIDTRADVAVNTYAADVPKNPLNAFRAFGTVGPARAFAATVVGVLPMTSKVEISVNPVRPANPADVVGQVIRFVNGDHSTAHTVTAVEQDRNTGNFMLTLGDDVFVGVAKVDAVESESITTSTALPLAPAYRGVTLADELCRFQHPVKSVANGKITLAKPLPPGHPIKPGEKVWLMDIGVGDSVEIPLVRDIKHK